MMMRNSLLLILLLQVTGLYAQPQARLQSKLDTATVTLGAPTLLHLSLHAPRGQSYMWPTPDSLAGKVQVLQRKSSDTIWEKDRSSYLLKQDWQLVAFDSGFFALPPIRLTRSSDTSKYLESEALLLTVKALPVDTTRAFREIKGPRELPYDWSYLWWYGAGLAFLIALSWWGYRYWKSRQQQPTTQIAEVKPASPPHVRAMEALQALQAEKLWQQGFTKEYHIRLSEITRLYIQERFGLNALEQTSDETLRSAKLMGLNPDVIQHLNYVLTLSDTAKFAKVIPLGEENDQAWKLSWKIVADTMPISETPEKREV
jgi:hypothetical protein